MTTINELRQAVDDLLGLGPPPAAAVYRSGATDAAYEAYLFCLVLRGVRTAGGTVQLASVGDDTRPPTQFVFRGSPGRIYGSSSNFGYAKCQYNGRQFEVHVDVQYVGTSGVMHEVDVSLLDRTAAVSSRDERRDPTAAVIRAALECKFYDSTLGVALVRTFTGLMLDLGTLKLARMTSNRPSRGISQFCTGAGKRPKFDAELTPLNQSEELQFIGVIVEALRSWLGRP